MKKSNLVILSISLLFLMSMTTVIGPVEISKLYSCLSPAPTVDGSFYSTAIEWDEGIPINVTLFNIDDQTDKLIIQIMAVQDNDYRIFFGVTIPNTIIEDDRLYLVFRDVEGAPLHLPPHKLSGSYGNTHDVIAMYMHNNHSVDMFTNGSIQHTAFPNEYIADTDAGGVENTLGKCYHDGSKVTVELRKPFDSGDTAGHDFNLVVNGSIDMFIWFWDGDLGKHYTMIREADNDYDFLKLLIHCTDISPVPVVYILLGLMVTSVASILYKKKRK
ncbi:MAG: hypothetical protein KAQ95_03575 [Candidatus Heimdallarchaeota archaeon]|nr:hypothetical protein [Candidatus Heimdallarchaeota archaeon]